MSSRWKAAINRALAHFYRVALELPVLAGEEDRVWLACGPHSGLGLLRGRGRTARKTAWRR